MNIRQATRVGTPSSFRSQAAPGRLLNSVSDRQRCLTGTRTGSRYAHLFAAALLTLDFLIPQNSSAAAGIVTISYLEVFTVGNYSSFL